MRKMKMIKFETETEIRLGETRLYSLRLVSRLIDARVTTSVTPGLTLTCSLGLRSVIVLWVI